MLTMRQAGQGDRQKSVHLAAPIGGDNTIAAGVDMPVTDSVYCYNMIGAEYGLRTRLGWREWVTGLGEQVRSLLPYTGGTQDGSGSKLFACTESGIWDVSASTATPTRIVTFGIQNDVSGWGVSTVFVTLAGHFLCYCDEANGYYVYSESNGTWVHVASAASAEWVTGTVYGAGARVTSAGVSYVTAAGGTAGATAPTGSGTGIDDGGVLWDYSPSVGGVDPANLAFVVAWKNRLWFVEKDTANGWYLPLSSIFGTATRFNFGNRFKAGGDLRGLWSWTYDGGSGIDDALVAVSGGGDVVIYRGTDPSSANTFALQGVWFVGAVPQGRRLCTDFGGDLLVMSSIGIMPVSKLVIGNVVYDRSQYQTFKISNLFNQLQAATSTLKGWSMRLHPQDACLMVLVPVAVNQSSQQLVMSLTTKGWHRYRDLPMGLAAEPWGGTLYFGTEDGRVCVNDGYVDGILLADPNAFTPIQWAMLSSFQNMGSPNRKRVQTIRPRVLSQGGNVTFRARAQFDWDLTEMDPVTALAAGGPGAWDTAVWDIAKWGGNYGTQQQTFGSVGIGSAVAIAIRGCSSSRMTLTGIDVSVDVGGVV